MISMIIFIIVIMIITIIVIIIIIDDDPQVVDTDGKTVLATLKAGSYFGEISILNMGTAGGL